jgi:hypothetical protein
MACMISGLYDVQKTLRINRPDGDVEHDPYSID